jgi:hypothetical protein
MGGNYGTKEKDYKFIQTLVRQSEKMISLGTPGGGDNKI